MGERFFVVHCFFMVRPLCCFCLSVSDMGVLQAGIYEARNCACPVQVVGEEGLEPS